MQAFSTACQFFNLDTCWWVATQPDDSHFQSPLGE